MTNSRLVSALKKAGFTAFPNGNKMVVFNAGKSVEWVNQDGNAVVICMRKQHSLKDVLTDYDDCRFASSIKEVLEFLTK